jgi:hypothetical protein
MRSTGEVGHDDRNKYHFSEDPMARKYPSTQYAERQNVNATGNLYGIVFHIPQQAWPST